ncbi:hypothetical protein [Kingella negevensis]|uniref:hypothetical protein n=1 Tax=Kingella negevensis TaxID=1522312 RepID=UPI00050A2E63|nr:hypothetical protein [Kingella negevensis]MDK4688657.1 hypothetical protein [Kingella negevensis]WII91599.1 hypothetical protein QEO93_03165 [Kingella negevensis]
MVSLSDLATALLGVAGGRTETSNWGSIHPDLIAQFKQIDAKGTETGVAFAALVKDGSVSQSIDWQSPFEEMTADKKNPNIGVFSQFTQTGLLGELAQSMGGEQQGGWQKLADFSDSHAGRSGMTKLNSRQVYTGHAPLKIEMTLIFRAWQDPQSEVITPFTALQRMAYPAKIAANVLDETVNGTRENGVSSAASTILFPSEAPKFVRLTYKGETYPPLVIESIGKPLDAPYSPMGDLFLEVPVSLQSYQSLDFADIQAAKNGVLGQFASEALNKVTSLLNPINNF